MQVYLRVVIGTRRKDLVKVLSGNFWGVLVDSYNLNATSIRRRYILIKSSKHLKYSCNRFSTMLSMPLDVLVGYLKP